MARPIPGPHRLSPEILVRAYAAGVFPMSEARDDPNIFWVDPELRGVIPLDGLHVSKSLRKVLRKGEFEVTADKDFPGVIEACAEPRPGSDGDLGTWINDEIIRAFCEMHELGLAHSVEVWRAGALVGGLYGISLKSAFMGESMFSRCRNASKVALVHLVARLRIGGFTLLDTQFLTEHLATMGGVEISDHDYLERLERALKVDAEFPSALGDGVFSADRLWAEIEALS
ncbi:leucyl/phenylalanyl-tRNA--protein transferase [Magnetovibrio sp. PR-2]|uniref:leucyl/phenylalanyl-tRNA--protein transferase n=1 Tax=Magnetovibrio sp. PR-2 TaxID=3120356 RepID=UPI002FCE34E5